MRKLWISIVLVVLSALVLSACSGSTTPNSSSAAPVEQQAQGQPSTSEMKHKAEPMSDTAYDIHYIDMTLHHHAGVIDMAEQAFKESSTVALKDLAQQTIATTQREIDWLKAYRQENHPEAGTMEDAMDMGAMSISTDASKSFDARYAEAMISHHQSSISMANEALNKVGHEELKQFAQSLLAAEQAEVTQLQQYLK